MPANFRWKTDEEIIIIVKAYMTKYPNASRNKIILNATGSPSRVRELAKKGLIKLPAPLPKGTNSNWAKHFRYASENNAKREGMKYNV